MDHPSETWQEFHLFHFALDISRFSNILFIILIYIVLTGTLIRTFSQILLQYSSVDSNPNIFFPHGLRKAFLKCFLIIKAD